MANETRFPGTVGVWHLMPKPRAQRVDNKTFIGTVDPECRIRVSSYNHDTGGISAFVVDNFDQLDDHTAPAVHIRSDGRLLAAWGPHHHDQRDNDTLFWRISEDPYDVSSWGPIRSKQGGFQDYPQIVEWQGNIRIYHRHGPHSQKDIWKYFESTDDGETFGEAQDWVDFSSYRDVHGDRPGYHRIYPSIYKEERDDSDRLHTAFGGYRQANQDQIRHFYLDASDGEYYDSHGTAFGVSDGTSITDMALPTAFGLDSWTTDHWTNSPKLQDILVKDGTPYVCFENILEVGGDGNLGDYRAGWGKYDSDAGEWITAGEIADMGQMVPDSGPAPGGYHKGGVRMDKEDPTTVFTSVETTDRDYQVQEFATSDEGATWTKVQNLSEDGSVDGYPGQGKRGGVVGVANNDGEELRVLWWGGEHWRFDNFDVAAFTEDTLANNPNSLLSSRWT